MNIILANCVVNNGNRGCVALTLTTMYLLDRILKEAGVSYTFYLFQRGVIDLGKHTLQTPFMDFEYETIMDISMFNRRNVLLNMIHFKSYMKSRRILKNCDYILDIGQGDSFSDIYGKGRFDWINGQHKLGHKYGKPYCMLPQTIGPFEDERIRQQALVSIGWAKSVMARDRRSCDFVTSNMADVQIKESIDVAFFMPYIKKFFDEGYIHVGLNVSALLWYGGYTRNNQFDLKDDYKIIVRDVIRHFLAQDKVMVHLIPHVVGGERHIENDYAVCYDLAEDFKDKKLVLAPLFFDPIAAKGYIAGMDFFMGARMHATIGAFSSGVPVVPMAYSRKFNGLFIDTLDYPYMIDLKTHTSDSVMEFITDSFAQRLELKRIVDERMTRIVRERGAELKEELKRFLNIN